MFHGMAGQTITFFPFRGKMGRVLDRQWGFFMFSPKVRHNWSGTTKGLKRNCSVDIFLLLTNLRPYNRRNYRAPQGAKTAYYTRLGCGATLVLAFPAMDRSGGYGMKIRGGSVCLSGVLFLIIFVCAFAQPATAADKFTRLNKWEVFGFGQYMGEDTVRTYLPAYEVLKTRGDIEQEAESNIAGGFGLGRTLNDYINVNGTFSYGQVNLTNRGGRQDTFVLPNRSRVREIKCTSHHWIAALNVEGYLFKDNLPWTNLKITPLIAGGLGTRYIHGQWDDTNVKIRDYVLTTSVGAGLRWDFSTFFLKALYQTTWYRMTDTRDSYQMNGATVAFGYTF